MHDTVNSSYALISEYLSLPVHKEKGTRQEKMRIEALDLFLSLFMCACMYVCLCLGVFYLPLFLSLPVNAFRLELFASKEMLMEDY